MPCTAISLFYRLEEIGKIYERIYYKLELSAEIALAQTTRTNVTVDISTVCRPVQICAFEHAAVVQFSSCTILHETFESNWNCAKAVQLILTPLKWLSFASIHETFALNFAFKMKSKESKCLKLFHNTTEKINSYEVFRHLFSKSINLIISNLE